MTLRNPQDANAFDPWFAYTQCQILPLESLGKRDIWTLDRKEWDYKTLYAPVKYFSGVLAESWETSDYITITYRLRKGVKWQDLPPVNGRELVASDVAYSYNRLFGLGDGFTKRSPNQGSATYNNLISVSAPDKYTVVAKWKEASLTNLNAFLDYTVSPVYIVAREVIDKYGDMNDWRRVVGAGPFILTDYVTGGSTTFIRNPNYFGFDERYPKNQLPYVDTLKLLTITDNATALAALRSGKIDMLSRVSVQDTINLGKTNPELLKTDQPNVANTLEMRNDTKPFNDIRVRTAMQMALDLPTMAKTLFGGLVDGQPWGLVGPDKPGYYTPYDQWPQSLKDEYTYNPAGAKKLLADAGYPNGFKTNVYFSSAGDMDEIQTIKAYLAAVGIDMEIRVKDPTTMATIQNAKTYDQCYVSPTQGSAANTGPLNILMTRRYSQNSSNGSFNNSAEYDAIYLKFAATFNEEEQKALVKQANDLQLKNHWHVAFTRRVAFVQWQPWFKGYSGEYGNVITGGTFPPYLARIWIDQNLKKAR